MSERLPKACIIGAGCSGFTTAKRLKDAGVPYDCFEMSDEVGGRFHRRLKARRARNRARAKGCGLLRIGHP